MQNNIYIYVYGQRIGSLFSEVVYPFLGLGHYRSEEKHVLSV